MNHQPTLDRAIPSVGPHATPTGRAIAAHHAMLTNPNSTPRAVRESKRRLLRILERMRSGEVALRRAPG